MKINSQNQISLTIDGNEVSVVPGTTIFNAAKSIGIDIPVLCHSDRLRPTGVCRVCVVEVQGARVLQPSCTRLCEPGMKVKTSSEQITRSRKMLVELLLADHPTPCEKHRRGKNCELELLAETLGISSTTFNRSLIRPFDNSSPVISVDHSSCILCDRCIRACDDLQSNDVIGRMNKGFISRIAFDLDSPMGKSTCVSCGECAAECPTGALIDKPIHPFANSSFLEGASHLEKVSRVTSVCPYCGVGCPIEYNVKEGKILKVLGAMKGHTEGKLCVKGRYGFDYSLHPQRLTAPLIRKSDKYPKKPFSVRSNYLGDGKSQIMEVFREATWDEVLDLAAQSFMEIKRKFGSNSLGGFGSAKGTNEEAYLFQKIIRQIFGTNNVDHCTRLCHASSVAALIECLGSGAVSNTFQEALGADCIMVVGSNTVENHPVAATYLKEAAKRGSTLIVIDPRRPPLANHAKHYVTFKPGTDVALFNAIMHVIIEEDLIDKNFIALRTEGFEKLKENVSRYTPEMAEKITGVPKKVIETIALEYGKAKSAMIFWGMGISQHTTGTDNTRAVISLCLMTGNIGRPATGLHPLRGQNNVQGASDVGLIPMFFTGYQSVKEPAIREKFEKAWGVSLDAKPGLTVVEIMHEALHGKIKGMFMMGENPVLSDPNINKVRESLQELDFLAVQDIFLTETAEFADVVFPSSSAAEKEGTYINTNRLIQLGRPAMLPPGSARTDLRILNDLANRMISIENNPAKQKLRPWDYSTPAQVWEEISAITPIFQNISFKQIEKEPVIWGGGPVIFTQNFPRGKGLFKPAEWMPAKELPDDDFPFVLNTGRVLYHWHTGTMTRRSKVLDERSPEAYVEVNPIDLRSLNVKSGEEVQVSSRRGSVRLKTMATKKVRPGNVFIPMHFKESAVNLLTIDELDPYGKIPEFKFCAVRVEKIKLK